MTQLRDVLEKLYLKYNRPEYIGSDPVRFVYRYDRWADREITAFLASALAYGRVAQIQASVQNLLDRMGPSPYDFVLNFTKGDKQKLTGFRHRFNTAKDISDLFDILRIALRENGSLENIFKSKYGRNDENILPALSGFIDYLLGIHRGRSNSEISRGLGYLLCRPEGGSACKRLNLFLCWMVRKDQVSPGLWKSIDKSKLIVPIDVHMGRLCRILELYKRKTVSMAAALEITRSFARIQPEDPAKYDFALSRIGIVENCNGKIGPNCELCELFGYCKNRQGKTEK